MKNKFAGRLSELLEEYHLSKRAFALLIGVSATSISDWTNGKIQPTADSIITVAEFFHVSTDYLLGMTD